jgi:hypothetical protein
MVMFSPKNFILALTLFAALFVTADAKKTKGPKITSKVYFDITIDGGITLWIAHEINSVETLFEP